MKKSTKNKMVLENDIIAVIKSKVDLPVLSLDDKLINNLKKEVIGQDKQIEEFLNVSKRNQINYNKNKCLSFLFSGSTGVGKTLLAKTYGKMIAGEKNVIKLDMSEFSESHSISKIIGAPPGYVGYSDSKNILDEIRDKPTCILILDEIERSNKKVLDLFMQVLDEGYTKDSLGRKVCFDNVTIIMTSNIGFNKTSMGFNNNINSVTNKLKDILGIEFINRISKIIVFNKMQKEDILKIINKNILNLKEEYKIKLDVSNNVIEEIVNESNYELFGARRIEEIIKEEIETIILDELIKNNKNITIKALKEKVIS